MTKVDIIELLCKLDLEDLLQWRATIDNCIPQVESELKDVGTDQYAKALAYDLDSLHSLKVFLLRIEQGLYICRNGGI